jgi:Tol biopolymer transport system component
MKQSYRGIFLILVMLILTACGPAGLPGSTLTSMPTLTRTPLGKTTPTLASTSPPTITTTPTSNPTPIGGGSGLIIFYRVYEKAKSEGSTEMVRFVGLEGIHSDGSGRFSLTGDTDWALNPAFSPDGNKIYYLEVIPETFKSFLHRINPDGSNDEQYAFPTIIDPESDFNYVTSFAISPDGKKIIVTTGGSNMIPPVMYLADFDGTGISNPLKLHEGGNAAWSPDGKKIAFVQSFGHNQIFTINADSSHQVSLTSSDYYLFDNSFPAWSPDGEEIIFSSDREGNGNSSIYIMNSDGTNPEKLNDDPNYAWEPSFSPDGTKIIFGRFVRSDNNRREICTMDPDGTNIIPLMDCYQDWCYGFAWGP